MPLTQPSNPQSVSNLNTDVAAGTHRHVAPNELEDATHRSKTLRSGSCPRSQQSSVAQHSTTWHSLPQQQPTGHWLAGKSTRPCPNTRRHQHLNPCQQTHCSDLKTTRPADSSLGNVSQLLSTALGAQLVELNSSVLESNSEIDGNKIPALRPVAIQCRPDARADRRFPGPGRHLCCRCRPRCHCWQTAPLTRQHQEPAVVA